MLDPQDLEQLKQASDISIKKAVADTEKVIEQKVNAIRSIHKQALTHVNREMGEIKNKLDEQCIHCRDTVTEMTKEIGRATGKAKSAQQSSDENEKSILRLEINTKEEIKEKVTESSKWNKRIFIGVCLLVVEETLRNFVF